VANGLALSANEKTLYVANADNNSLAVFDVSKPGRSQSKGFIPVGWYPTSVRVVDKRIFVAMAKGLHLLQTIRPAAGKQKCTVSVAPGEV
jgi:DNA-binding beta-propeller fold protein YncE